MLSFSRKIEHQMVLYDLAGKPLGVLKNAYNIEHEETLNDAEVLTFSLPRDDRLARVMMNDMEIIYMGKRFFIAEMNDGRDANGKPIFDVICPSYFVKLLDTFLIEITIDRKTPKAGLEQIVARTGWVVGRVEALSSQETQHSMSEKRKSALWAIRQWAKITGHEIQFDTVKKEINLVKQVGTNRGYGFRYRKNLKEIKRTIRAPEATVLYPYGKNGLSIESVNDNKPYVEDYSWYTSLGIPLIEAKQKYRKEYVWEDERFLLAGDLMRAAQEKLKVLSQPVISYQCKVIDLSALTGNSQYEFSVGDYVNVFDDELGINVQTRIVRMRRFPDEPYRNEVELSYMIPGIHTQEQDQLTSSDVSLSQPSFIMGTNEKTLSIGTSVQTALSLVITNFSSVNAQVGLSLIGQASTTMTVEISFMYGGKPTFNTIKQTCQAGFVTIGVPFLLLQMPPGSAFLDVQMKTSAGTLTIDPRGLQVFVYAANLLGGISDRLPRANVTEEIQWKNVISPYTSRFQSVVNGQIVSMQVVVPVSSSIVESISQWRTHEQIRPFPAVSSTVQITLK
ncbi:hypothetical protein AA906_07500 [Geobacillus stearothermophilus]|uniref:phage tail protein n=1 Tax=Geobacillus stearothermophilus TaxID=1422 RepID=UPI00066FB8F1|nr:phage tail protein [Geobacillus stearothermophilus]KMY59959.1 hypothetical protein AA906_07500 [Geobacillus stearothermophilus]